MTKNLGLNYMGSKRKLAPKIINFIVENNKNVKYIYDLFGGGGAISFVSIQFPNIKKVIYNEINTSITSLLQDVIMNGISNEYYKFYDRKYFIEHKDDKNFIGGLLQTCWSFGGNQKDYLYGANKEDDKKLLHKIIIDKDIKSLNKLKNKYNLNIPTEIFECNNFFNINSIKTIRSKLNKIFNNKGYKDLTYIEHLDKTQHIDQIQHLGNIYKLKEKNKLEILNQSYDDVKINTPVDETIIYLDPPYKGTSKYKHDIDHEKLEHYINNSEYKIYVSGYNNVYNLNLVNSFNHINILSATNNNKKVIENLYCNRS